MILEQQCQQNIITIVDTTSIKDCLDITKQVCTLALLSGTLPMLLTLLLLLVLPEKFRQSVVVLVWSTTVLPNVRLMPSLRLMLSTEPEYGS